MWNGTKMIRDHNCIDKIKDNDFNLPNSYSGIEYSFNTHFNEVGEKTFNFNRKRNIYIFRLTNPLYFFMRNSIKTY